MEYAVIESGGHQHRVGKGERVRVARLSAEAGKTVTFERVLLVGAGRDVRIGDPLVKGGAVKAEVVAHGRADKVEIVKFKRRKKYRRHRGHRQDYTEVQIREISG